MARFHGAIGFAETVETSDSVWEDRIIERDYYGDLLSDRRAFNNSQSITGDINVTNEISILADKFADTNYLNIRYAIFRGHKWKVVNAKPERPRIILSLGGLYA